MKEALFHGTIGVVTATISFWIADRTGINWLLVMPLCFAVAYGIDVALRWAFQRKD